MSAIRGKSTAWTWVVGAIALLSLVAGVSSGASVHPAGATVTVGEDGATPSALSLTGSVSGNLCPPHAWTFYYSTTGSNGPWTALSVDTNSADSVSYGVGDLTPGATYYWYTTDDDSCTGNINSNTLTFTQPAAATLTGRLATPTSATFSWDNNAHYNDEVSFTSYTLLQSINEGTWTTVMSFTSASAMAYTASGLSPSTSYSFEVETNDECCGTYATPTYSNVVDITPPGALTASAQASPTSVTVGTSVSFTCAAAGGEPPYTYSWNFGDGSTGSGESATHTYSTAGTMDVICTVTDSFSTEATGPTAVTVTSSSGTGNPGNGNGNGNSNPGPANSASNDDLYLGIGVVVVVVIIAIAALAWSAGRKKASPPPPR